MTRHVFANAQVCHVWASQSQYEGRSHTGRLYFRDATLYSYRDNYPIASIYTKDTTGDEKLVLFRQDGYSNSTKRHISLAKRAASHLPDIDVTRVVSRDYRDFSEMHEANWKYFEQTTLELCAKSKRARSNKERLAGHACDTAESANRYAAFFDLPQRLAVPYTPEAIGAIQAQAAERERLAKIACQEKHAVEIASAKRSLEAWAGGDTSYFTRQYWHELPVRMRVNGEAIETSHVASFPLEHGKRAFAFIAGRRAAGEAWETNGHAIHLGHFKIDRIAADGTVTAGCHTVEWPEIERIAKLLGIA